MMHCEHMAEFYRRKALTCWGREKRECEALAWAYMNAAANPAFAETMFSY